GGMWQYYLLQLAHARGSLQAMNGLPPPASFEGSAPRVRSSIILSMVWLFAKLGEHDKARALLADVPPRLLSRMPVLHGDLGLLCDLAESYVGLCDPSGARRVHAQLLPHASANAVGPCLEYRGSVEHYLGALASSLGDHDEALERLARAELQN